MWAFFYTVRRSMLSIEHLPQAYCCSTAQHSTAIIPAQSSQASTCRSERDNASKQASKQSWREPARRRAFTARCLLKTTEEIKMCPAYKKLQALTSSQAAKQLLRSGVMVEGFAFFSNLRKIQHCSFSPSFPLQFRRCMRRPG